MTVQHSLAFITLIAATLVATCLASASPTGGLPARPYSCDPNTCRWQDKCHCASTSAPKGIPPEQTPQFITVTFDDNLHTSTYANIDAIMDNRVRSANGCPLHATFFTSQDWTDYDLLRRWHRRGHEVACHTVTHTTDFDTTKQGWYDEMVGCKLIMSTLAGIPEEDIVGARAPFLHYNRALFEVLHENGFRYESSIVEQSFPDPANSQSWGSLLSTSRHNRIFPYTLQDGLGQTCTGPDPCFDPEWEFPGMFEIPMWTIDNEDDSMLAFMDYTEVEALKANFLYHYNGNRAPMGIFLHPRQYVDTASVAEFLRWAAEYDNVYFVNNIEMLDWMDNPMDVDEMKTSFPCLGDELAPRCDNPVQCTSGFKTCGLCPTQPLSLTNWKAEMCDKGLPKQCAGHHCVCGAPVAGCTVGAWSEWSPCSVTCDGGQQQRQRTVQRADGLSESECAYEAEQSRACNSVPCAELCSDVGAWGPWSECDCTIDGPAVRTRTRVVHADMAHACAATETSSCHDLCAACDTTPATWSAWGECSAVCGGTHTRQKVAVVEGLVCKAEEVEEADCVASCGECLVSEWSSWSTCSSPCAGGHQTRSRSIAHPGDGSHQCPHLQEQQGCNEDACRCDVSEWSDWSSCSSPCGGGVHQRERTILHRQGASPCPSVLETALCNEHSCNCQVGGWSDWSTCSRVCGGGVRSRVRDVRAIDGELNCPAVSQVESCNDRECTVADEVHCQVGEWTPFTPCSAECGKGVHSRQRELVVQASNGAACGVPLAEQRVCDAGKCGNVVSACASCWVGTKGSCSTPAFGECFEGLEGAGGQCPGSTESCSGDAVHCQVSGWSRWSTCSSECRGQQYRVREVITRNARGGVACPTLFDTRACGHGQCNLGVDSDNNNLVAAMATMVCHPCWPGTSGPCRGPGGVCFDMVADSTTECPPGTLLCADDAVLQPESSVKFSVQLPGLPLPDLRVTHKPHVAAALATVLEVLPSQVIIEGTETLEGHPHTSVARVRVRVPTQTAYIVQGAGAILQAVRSLESAHQGIIAELIEALASQGVNIPSPVVQDSRLVASGQVSGDGVAGQEGGHETTGRSGTLGGLPPALLFSAVAVALLVVAAGIAWFVVRLRGPNNSTKQPRSNQSGRYTPQRTSMHFVSPAGRPGSGSSHESTASTTSRGRLSMLSTPRVVRELHGSSFVFRSVSNETPYLDSVNIGPVRAVSTPGQVPPSSSVVDGTVSSGGSRGSSRGSPTSSPGSDQGLLATPRFRAWE